ncbi:MAG TPA: hypothetical protein VIT18_00030, partial [Terrimicrobiaceae bacterium]
RPDYIYFFSEEKFYYIQEDVNAAPPPGDPTPIFQFIPPSDSQFSATVGPFEDPPIPSAPIPQP